MWVSLSSSLNQIFEVIPNGGIWKLYWSSGKKAVTGTQSLGPGSRDASDRFPDVVSLRPSGVVSWSPLTEMPQSLRLTTLESTSYERGKAHSRSRIHVLGKCVKSTELFIVHFQFIDAWIRSEILRETFLIVVFEHRKYSSFDPPSTPPAAPGSACIYNICPSRAAAETNPSSHLLWVLSVVSLEPHINYQKWARLMLLTFGALQ